MAAMLEDRGVWSLTSVYLVPILSHIREKLPLISFKPQRSMP